jgi:hypothetical protein
VEDEDGPPSLSSAMSTDNQESRDSILVVLQWMAEGSRIPSIASTLGICPCSGCPEANSPNSSLFAWIALQSTNAGVFTRLPLCRRCLVKEFSYAIDYVPLVRLCHSFYSSRGDHGGHPSLHAFL